MASRLRADMADHQPLILDGGLATELEAHGIHLQGDPLWSARLLHTNPQAIREAHYRFLLSGADVITTATYQASITGFITHMDVSSECARELLMSGVHLAKESVKRFVSESRATEQKCPLVAGSVGPYGAFLHNGSEYTGAYAEKMSIEELKVWHRPQIGCLAAAGADLIAFETIPSIKEAEALVELLREFPNTKAWLSFSCKDGRCISDGSLFTDAVTIANTSTQLVAVGVNCCSPALVEQLLDSAGSLLSPDMGWVVYPNSGEEWDTEQGLLQMLLRNESFHPRETKDPSRPNLSQDSLGFSDKPFSKRWMTPGKTSASILELSHTWMKQGAFLIGGCCRTGPAHIQELRHKLKGSCTSAASAV